MHKFAPFVFLLFLISACSNPDKIMFSDKGRTVPAFSADSAFEFVRHQLAFGPRVPNSEAHQKTLSYYEQEFKQYAGASNVFLQKFEADGYDEKLALANVIAAFNTASPDRIMLSAHWDSRPRADMDTARVDEPIIGADDGASGVAVLMELARIMSENPPPIGVDIVLFDGEDYGTSGDLSRYFLGSRYWAKNPPVPGYNPRFGILLDMVGGKDAVFLKEEYSRVYAPSLLNGIWDIARKLNYDWIFRDEKGAAVSDDHVIINQDAGIPMINIINHTRDNRGVAQFAPYWHTHADNIDIISKETLQAVGDVLTELIYNRIE